MGKFHVAIKVQEIDDEGNVLKEKYRGYMNTDVDFSEIIHKMMKEIKPV